MSEFNVETSFDEYGRIQTSDEDLNQIIRAVEQDTGALMGTVIPAVTFDDAPDEKVYLILLSVYPVNGEETGKSRLVDKPLTIFLRIW